MGGGNCQFKTSKIWKDTENYRIESLKPVSGNLTKNEILDSNSGQKLKMMVESMCLSFEVLLHNLNGFLQRNG